MSDMIWNGSYTLGNSQDTQITAGTGIKVTTPAAGQIQISNDETVIFDGHLPELNGTITLSEPWTNFKMIRVSGGGNTMDDHYYSEVSPSRAVLQISWAYNWMNTAYLKFTPTSDPKVWTYVANTLVYYTHTDTTVNVKQNDISNIGTSTKFKIVGINRIAGGN